MRGINSANRVRAERSLGASTGRHMNILDDIKPLLFSTSGLPERTGPHGVGTTQLKVRPPERSNHSGRSITVQLWYPIDKDAKTASRTSLMGRIRRLLHVSWAEARHGSPLAVAPAKLPLITYVPGANGRHDDNTFTLANLASHGFILAAIDDPFREAITTVSDAALDGADDPLAGLCAQRIRCGVDTASALLDGLEALSHHGTDCTWAKRLDLRQVGILGYALGGVVAAQTALADPRYSVAANLDGTLDTDVPLVRAPYLLMLSDVSAPAAENAHLDDSDGESESPPQKIDACREAQQQATLPESHVIEVAGTKREHFSDRLMLPSAFARARHRAANFRRIRAIIDSYTVAFFSTYLRGAPHPLMCVRHSPYAEVRFINSPQVHGPWLYGEPVGHG